MQIYFTKPFIPPASLEMRVPPASDEQSSFEINNPVDEFLPQTHKQTPDKKNFANLKDYIAYLMFLVGKMDAITPPQGKEFVRLEDKNQLLKFEKELGQLTTNPQISST